MQSLKFKKLQTIGRLLRRMPVLGRPHHESILATYPEMLSAKDVEGRFVYANQQFIDFSGVAQADLLGIRDVDHPNPDIALGGETARLRVLATQVPVCMQVELQHQSTKERRVYLAQTRPMYRKRACIGVVTYFRDITEQMRIEAALRDSRDAAEETSKAKTMLLASIGHDLRQPLQGALMFSAALSEGNQIPPEALDSHRRLAAALESLRGMAERLLDVAAVDLAERPRLEAVVMSEILQQTELVWQHVASLNGLQLLVDDTTAVVYTDRILLGRMLRNLVENAIRYTPTGHVSIRIQPEGAGFWRLSVTDSGPGIPAHLWQDIWQEFTQLERSPGRERAKGMGLGLSVVRNLSTILNHPVRLDSPPGQGATFSIILPEATADNLLPVPRGARIVLLTSDPLLRVSLRSLAERWAIELREAGTFAEWSELSRSFAPQLLLIDAPLAYPNVPHDIRAEMKQESFPVILLGRANIHPDGFSAQLDKPVGAVQLREALHSFLRSREPPV